jgi:hypothetical protein
VPFTASHPAAVLPLIRRGSWVSAGLVTGSMAPDLPSFVPLNLTHDQTHPLTAILWPDGLLALGLLVAWWALLRPGLGPLWPAAARRVGPPGWRDPALRRGSTARLRWAGWLVVSELVGLATHLLWDSFTHIDGYTVRRWKPLSHMVFSHPTYAWLQFVSSVGGLAVVLVYLGVQWWRTPPRGAPEAAAPWVRVVVLAAMTAVTLATADVTWTHGGNPDDVGRAGVLSTTVKDAGGALLVSAAVWSVAWVLWTYLRSRDSRRSAKGLPPV